MAELTKKSVLVTGAAGFIGRPLCAKMLGMGWQVKAVCRKQSDVDILPQGAEVLFINSIEEGSFRDQDFNGVDTVIHLAAHVHILGGPQDSLETFRKVNVSGTISIASLAAKAKVKRFIFISSVKVNGEGASRPYTENDLAAPEDAYGSSKMEAEQALADIAGQAGLETVILRLPLVYGPGVKANFRDLIKIVASGFPLPFKEINNRRSFLYLGNLVDAIIVCATHPKASGETFLVSDGQDVSTPDLIEMISIAMNKKPALFSLHPGVLKVLFQIAGKTEGLKKLAGSLFVDSSKIRDLLDWKPPFTMEEGIREMVKKI